MSAVHVRKEYTGQLLPSKKPDARPACLFKSWRIRRANITTRQVPLQNQNSEGTKPRQTTLRGYVSGGGRTIGVSAGPPFG